MTETPTLPTTLPSVPGLAIDTSGPIRRFVDARLQASVAEICRGIPADKHACVIAVANLTEVRLVGAVRIGDDFSLIGVLERQWKGGELKAEAALVWTP